MSDFTLSPARNQGRARSIQNRYDQMIHKRRMEPVFKVPLLLFSTSLCRPTIGFTRAAPAWKPPLKENYLNARSTSASRPRSGVGCKRCWAAFSQHTQSLNHSTELRRYR